MKLVKSLPKLLILFSALALILSACDLTDNPANDPESTQVIKTIHPATLTAISAAAQEKDTPIPDPLGISWSKLEGVKIDFWYLWDVDEPGVGLNALVDRFNRENTWGITVIASDQGLTHDPLDSIETAFQEGVFPHVMLIDTNTATKWFQDGYTLDLQPYFSDPAAGLEFKDLNDFYPGIIDFYSLADGTRPGIPFTQSIQVIYYNQTWAADLGYTYAPGSLSDLTGQICTAAKEGQESAGMIIYPEAANIAGWVYAYNGDFLDDDGVYTFSSPEILDVINTWRDLIRNQCGTMVTDYPNPMVVDIEFTSFNQGQALMVMNTSQQFGQVHLPVNVTGREDDWTMLPFIGPDGNKSVAAQVQSGVIMNTTPEKQLASWLFLKYLTSPEIQAEWIQYSYNYPTRKDSLEFLEDFRISNPDWAKGLDLLRYSRTQPVEPAWDIVHLALGDAFEEILALDSQNPEKVLNILDATAAELQSFGR